MSSAPEAQPTPAEAPARPSRLQLLARLWGRWPGTVAKLLLATIPAVWIARNVDLRQVLSHTRHVSPWVLLAAVVISLGGPLVGGIRWRVLMRAYGASAPPGVLTLARHHLVGIYFTMIPSGLAGDAIRGFRVRRHLDGLLTSYTVLLVERICGFLGLMLIALGAVLAGSDLADGETARALHLALGLGVGLASALALAVLGAPYLLQRLPRMAQVVARIPLLGPLLQRVPPASSPWPVAAAVLLSLVTQGVVIVSFYLIARNLTPIVTFGVCTRVVPFIMLLSHIPLTPAAIGQRDLVAIHFFGLVGVPRATALTISLLAFGVVVAICGLGGITYLLERTLGLVERPPLETERDPG